MARFITTRYYGQGNQCTEGKCMREALKVFACTNSDGIPPEVVRVMLQY